MRIERRTSLIVDNLVKGYNYRSDLIRDTNLDESENLLEGVDYVKLAKENWKTVNREHDAHGEFEHPHDIIDHFAKKADPFKNSRNIHQIMHWYTSGQIAQEDHAQVKQDIKDFHEYSKQGKIPEKDINKYDSVGSLRAALDYARPEHDLVKEPWLDGFSKSRIAKMHKDTEVVHDDSDYNVRRIKNKAAAQVLGHGCSFCTNSGDWFDKYDKDGPLYFFYNKRTGERLQMHQASSQFRDKNNVEVTKGPEFTRIKQQYKEGIAKVNYRAADIDKASSKFTSHEDLDKLASSEREDVVKAVSNNEFAHPSTLTKLADHDSPDISRNVLKNKFLPDEGIRKVYNRHGSNTDIVAGVLKHSNTGGGTIDDIVSGGRHNDNEHALTLAAGHGNTHTNTLTKLAGMGIDSVSSALAANPKSPRAVLDAMPEEHHYTVASNISAHPETLHKLATTGDEMVQMNVARNTSSSEHTLDHLARNSKDPWLIKDVAANPSVGDSTVAYLYGKHNDKENPDHQWVREHIAGSRVASKDMLHTLASEHPNIVAGNSAASSETLSSLHSGGIEGLNHEGISRMASNNSAPPSVLHSLSGHEDYKVVQRVINNDSTHHSTLHDLADHGDYQNIVEPIARSHRTSDATLEKLRKHSSTRIRNLVKSNIERRSAKPSD